MLRSIVVGMLVLGLLVSFAPAGIIEFGDFQTFSELQGGSIQVGDKIFSEFKIAALADGGAIRPKASTIMVIGCQDESTGDYGLRFVMSWIAGKDQVVNGNVSFKVAVDPNTGNGHMIKDVSMMLTGASATNGGLVAASETVYDRPIGLDAVELARLSTSVQGNKALDSLAWKDHAEFTPVSAIWVKKDISVSGGSLTDGSGHLSEFYQFFSQVPEPASMSLLALGTLAMLRRRK